MQFLTYSLTQLQPSKECLVNLFLTSLWSTDKEIDKLCPEYHDCEACNVLILSPLRNDDFDLIWLITLQYLIAFVTAFMSLLQFISQQVIAQQMDIG